MDFNFLEKMNFVIKKKIRIFLVKNWKPLKIKNGFMYPSSPPLHLLYYAFPNYYWGKTVFVFFYYYYFMGFF